MRHTSIQLTRLEDWQAQSHRTASGTCWDPCTSWQATDVTAVQLFILLGKLTGLQEVQLAACSLPDSSLDALSQRFPRSTLCATDPGTSLGGCPRPPA